MSTAVQVLPSTLISTPFTTDRAIIGATDISNLYYHAGQVTDITKDVKSLKDPRGLGVFKLATVLSEKVGGGILQEYGAGPLALIKKTDGLSLQTFFSPPLFATILVDSTYGSSAKGISTTIGPGVLQGKVAIIKGTGSEHHLTYDITITIGGKSPEIYAGDITLNLS